MIPHWMNRTARLPIRQEPSFHSFHRAMRNVPRIVAAPCNFVARAHPEMLIMLGHKANGGGDFG